MSPWRIVVFSLLVSLCFLCLAADNPASPATLRRSFESPPDDARIMMRWWWFGSAVTHTELERELRLMKEGGIGGVEIQPVYPLALDDPQTGFRNLPFLSAEFLNAVRFTSGKARELGLRVDLTLGSGWPYGGPNIPAGQAAGRLRIERVAAPANAGTVPLPQMSEAEKLLAVFLAPGAPRDFDARAAREISEIRDGAVALPGKRSGENVLLFFIAGRTRQMVKRAAVGSEGLVLDHYDRAALDNHLKWAGEPLLRAFGSNPPYAIFCDSLEVFSSDWTGDLLEQFRKRRGYDLKPYLPALAGDIGEKTGAIRHDWGQTLTEVANERFLAPLAEWARQHRTLLRAQTYGVPPVSLSSNALVDLPEGEQPHWRRFSPSRWAASASHLYGRPVTSSETWTWLHSPAFRATPLDMKAEADLHFLQGINQLIGHGWPYSPESAGEPGWRFYAAAVFNHHNPWWLVMPDITRYLQRVSFLLRQGRPANDIALYLPTADARAQFTTRRPSINDAMDTLLGPQVIPQILDAGFNFDFIDDEAIGRLGIPYAAIVLPNVERIPLPACRKLEQYAAKGGVVIATRRAPALAPGLMEAERDTPEIKQISERMFGGGQARTRLLADESQLGAALAGLTTADLAMSPAAPEIGFIHRRLDSAEIYFLANTSNQGRQTLATFRVQGLEPEWWDPFTGTTSPAKVRTRSTAGVSVPLDLEPYGSRVLVFSKLQQSRDQSRDRKGADGEPKLPPPLDLTSGWKVSFEKLDRTVPMDRLRSWTDDAETKYFSGSATYEKSFEVPAAFLQPIVAAILDFGEGTPVQPSGKRGPGMRALLESPVREAAVVYVNGRRAASVWRPPYEVEVTRFLRAGQNTLRIVVGNLAINALAGQPPADYRALNQRYGERFQAQDMDNLQPLPSGLLGPVRLRAR
ncbi:MAG: glycosyl hydrolase [Acidobacteria bacterium]|nr:glycosyl hydrolase [Acidobacteriota bacterium]